MRRLLSAALAALVALPLAAQETRLLRQPTVSATQVAFAYGGDLWSVGREGGEARRLTSTPAEESDPHFSPDGKWIAFTSTRSGSAAVYVMPADGGDPRRLTWHPAGDHARGWTPDGKQVLFASDRGSAPTNHTRLFTIPVEGGAAKLVPAPMGFRGSFSPDGRRIVVDRVDRWDVEFRNYRGGQNTPLTVLDLGDLGETRLPHELTTDVWPVWMGETIYFLSDRDDASNVWAYDVRSKAVRQLTRFRDADAKALTGFAGSSGGGVLALEQDGYVHLVDPATGAARRLAITVRGDFPWAAPRWTDVSRSIDAASLGPAGRRALFQARGDIYTVPVEKGDARNLTRSPGAADRAPVWAPDGQRVAWFSDEGAGYRLMVGSADALSAPRAIAIGDAKMAWTPAWSPDGSRIAFVDDRARLRVVEVASGKMTTADAGGVAQDRGSMNPAWSPDSRWLAYAKTFPNQFRRVVVWSVADGKARPITDALASAEGPVWDRNGKWLYFLASTDLGLRSGWADLGSLTRTSTAGVYVALLRADEPTPFTPQSDEEAARLAGGGGGGGPTPNPGTPGDPAPPPSTPATPPAGGGSGGARGADSTRPASPGDSARASTRVPNVRIDFERFDRRILALPMPVRGYAGLIPGPAGTLFVAENVPNQPGVTLHKWDMAKRRADVFVSGVTRPSASGDGRKLMWSAGAGEQATWVVAGTEMAPRAGEGRVTVSLRAQLDPAQEWRQIFDEAWRIERDFFYDPGLHGADWRSVRARYEPLVPFVRHRADLTYLLDQMGGELAVGHSFVRGGDYPATDSSQVGLLGADVVADGERWKIARIYTSESWNPGLRAPLDAPGVKARVGDYILAVNGEEVTTRDELFRALDGTADRQTVLRLAERANGAGAWTVTVVPVRSETQLRQRAWVEDNRRRVDSLSGGKLAYVWVPNTGGGAISSFDRYYFAQQEKQGAVIDERFNSGGLLDDYMVSIMTRRPVGGVTNDVPGGTPYRLPMAGLLGPKVLLANEQAGSGGDYFPWVFRTLGVGPVIGTRTWGGLVASCVPYPLVDRGTITAPCSAVFDAQGNFPAEGVGVAPDIEVLQDARAVAQGRDPQLERGVQEALKLLDANPPKLITKEPPPPVRSKRPGRVIP